ncbi:unnamed protein product [Oncorhynchus mykiss]|uniref:Zinc finger protein 512 C2HC zinc finger domain-containing protein n=1 Tax=Oncorhynchus mykiss TaxID=8022 RepID=A0A060XZG6_ONCMY|nr:unnamed protein product [Oncorhynchus mykiss]
MCLLCPGLWKTHHCRLCSSKSKRPRRCLVPPRTGSVPPRGERGNSTHTPSPLSSRLTPPPTPRGAARAKMRGAVYSHHTPMKTMRGQGTPGRKQKTPKKFTGEQPSISGTFGLKGMNKVEEKLKAGRVKRLEGGLFSEELQRKHPGPASRRELPPLTSAEAQWQHAISERGEVVCPTCSIVTRKTISGLKKHMEICRKVIKCHEMFNVYLYQWSRIALSKQQTSFIITCVYYLVNLKVVAVCEKVKLTWLLCLFIQNSFSRNAITLSCIFPTNTGAKLIQ